MTTVDLYEAMQTTRAVRKLRPDPIPDDVLERVLTAATWAPSGGNRQPWRVLVVRDVEAKTALARLYRTHWSSYAARGREALKALPESARERPERTLASGDYLAEHFHEAPAVLVFCFDPGAVYITDTGLGRPAVVGGASIYPAVQNALLACRAEGLGCVLTTLLCASEREIKTLLNIPDPWGTAAYLPIGYPLGRGHGPVQRRAVADMTFGDRWGAPFVGAAKPL